MTRPNGSAIDRDSALRMFAALSQPGRFAVFLHVTGAGPGGVAVQGLTEALGITGSALTLHLRALDSAGLIHAPPRRGPRDVPMVAARFDRCAEMVARLSAYCRTAGWDTDQAGVEPTRAARLSTAHD